MEDARTGMTHADLNQLTSLLAHKLECLSRLRELGREQQELIENRRLTELIQALSLKQRLIDRLNQIESDLRPFHAQHPDARPWRSPEARQQCAKMVELCQLLSQEILRQEEEGQKRLKEQRDDTAAQLRQLHSAWEAREAYARLSRGVP